jgi:hypothetical protein
MKVNAKTQDTNLERFGPLDSVIPYVLFWDVVYCALRLSVELPVGCYLLVLSTYLGIPTLLYIS